ncbi:hypothetical protein BJ165DRAFT_1525088 [Panaeolus papilionaceus]|nr:hypothetical protein BJ165DRAFT_1525088 [Panaeolus papilionaceus]
MTSSNLDILPSYIDDLHQHQVHTQQHLKGRITTELPLPPSFFPPSSYWTSTEKDLFFHGLTIHSRLRPELIAEHIKTKSTYDVCLYLDALQVAAEREALPDDELPLHHRLEPALDVSTRWINYEESLAEDLIDRDICVGNVGRSTRDLCNCPEVQHWDTKITGLETKECTAFLNHIDNTGLQTLDSILKEAEDEKTATASESGCTSSRHGTANPGGSDDDKSNRSASAGPEMGDEGPEILDPKARRRMLKRLYMRRKRAEQLGRELDLRVEKLRPGRASRPRGAPKPRPKTYKTKLKGRGRGTSVHSEAPGANEDESIASVPSESNHHTTQDITGHEQYGVHSKGGMTKRYRIKEALSESGIDGDALQAAELDLVIFSAIPRIINKMHDASFAGAISISALRMMNVLLKQFIMDVVRCLIITKEQENRLKGKLKVWKNDEEEITVENVAECLQVLGFYISSDEHEDHSSSSSLETPVGFDGQTAGSSLQNYQSIMLPPFPAGSVQDDGDSASIGSDSDSDDSVRDAQQDKEDEEASLLYERELWSNVC